MINRIYILVFFLLSFFYSNYFSVFGVGEKINNYDAGSIALGNSKFFTINNNELSHNSSSSFINSKLLHFYFHNQFNYYSLSKSNISQQINNLALYIPIFKRNVFSFQLKPYINSDFNINSHISYIDGTLDSLSYYYNLSSKGGISSAVFSFSMFFSNNFKLGIDYARFFGRQEKNNLIYLIQNNDSSNKQIVTTNIFSGNKLNLDYRFTYGMIEFAGNLGYKIKFKINDLNQYSSLFLDNIGLGLQYRINEIKKIVFEYSYRPSHDYNNLDDIFTLQDYDLSQLSTGYSSKKIFPNYSNINTLSYGFGFFIDQVLNLPTFVNIGSTAGFSIDFLDSKHVINFTIKAGMIVNNQGILSYNFKSIKNQKYVQFLVSFDTGDRWFKRKGK